MQFWQELRRRRVYRMAGLYIVGAWLVIQVADISFPAWGVPETALRYLFIAAAACFPVALIFSWFYDITSKGIVRTEPAGEAVAVDLSLKRTDYALLAALVAIGLAVLLGSAERIQEEIESAPPPSGAIAVRDNSIAVLPFTNLDANPDTGYFSDGITEEILHRLSTLGALHVLASTSSFAFRNSQDGPAAISAKLGVRFLLHGSIRRDSDFVRVTARLVDDQGFQVWSQSFDRKLESIFAIQSEIASTVSSEIINEIVPLEALPAGRTTDNMEAYNAYLVGKTAMDTRIMGWQEEARAAFREAIELDPGFAPAYAGLAASLSVWSGRAHLDEARKAAERSLELDPDLAEGHAILGMYVVEIEEDYGRGEALLRRAIELDPSLSIAYNWLAGSLNRQGLVEAANATLDKGLEVDPLNPPLIMNVARRESRTGNFDRAEQLFKRLMNLPEPPGPAYLGLFGIRLDWGRYADALAVAKERARRHAATGDRQYSLFLSLSYALLGMTEQADYWKDVTLNAGETIGGLHDILVYLLPTRSLQSELAVETRRLLDEVGDCLGDQCRRALWWLSVTNIAAGEYERGVLQLEAVIRRMQRDSGQPEFDTHIDLKSLEADWGDIVFISLRLGFAYQQVGRTEDAERLLRDLEALLETELRDSWDNPEARYKRAELAMLLGDTDGAYQALSRAADLGWAMYYVVANSPVWADVLGEPRFRALMDEVKANVDQQRAAVEAIEAEHDFRAEFDRLIATQR